MSHGSPHWPKLVKSESNEAGLGILFTGIGEVTWQWAEMYDLSEEEEIIINNNTIKEELILNVVII